MKFATVALAGALALSSSIALAAGAGGSPGGAASTGGMSSGSSAGTMPPAGNPPGLRPTVGLVLTGLVSAVLTMQISIHGHEVKVPALKEMTVAEGRSQTAGLGLNLKNIGFNKHALHFF